MHTDSLSAFDKIATMHHGIVPLMTYSTDFS